MEVEAHLRGAALLALIQPILGAALRVRTNAIGAGDNCIPLLSFVGDFDGD